MIIFRANPSLSKQRRRKGRKSGSNASYSSDEKETERVETEECETGSEEQASSGMFNFSASSSTETEVNGKVVSNLGGGRTAASHLLCTKMSSFRTFGKGKRICPIPNWEVN